MKGIEALFDLGMVYFNLDKGAWWVYIFTNYGGSGGGKDSLAQGVCTQQLFCDEFIATMKNLLKKPETPM